MSLARRLMNDMTNGNYSDVIFENLEPAYTDDSIVVETAMVELVNDIYAIHEAIDVADIIGEISVIKEGASPEILMENIFTDTIKKLKEAMVKFWKKVKAWFKKAFDYLKSLTMKGEKFVKEFGDKIKTKSKKVQGFTFKTYDYDIKKGDDLAKKIQDTIYAEVNKFANDALVAGKNVETATVKAGVDKVTSGKENPDEILSDDKIEDIIKGMASGATNTSELTSELTKTYHGGLDDKIEVVDFKSGPSVDVMLDIVKNSKTQLDNIKKDESLFDSNMKSIIGQFDKFKATGEGDVADAQTKIAKAYSTGASKLLNIGKVGFTVKAQIYKEANNAFLAILRALIGTGKVTEGVEVDDDEFDTDADVELDVEEACAKGTKDCEDEPATESLLEQALNAGLVL